MPTAGQALSEVFQEPSKGAFVQLLGLLGAFLSVKQLSSVNPLAFLRVGVIIPILQMGTPRHQEVN